jgi:hypothetical protein
MADDEWDMSASTQQFQAFARSGEGEPAPGGLNTGLVVGVAALVLVALIGVLAVLVI